MQPDTHSYQIYNYSDIFSEYFFHDKAENSYLCPEHALIFVFSGKLTIYNGNIERSIHKGEYIFLRKDTNTYQGNIS